MSDSDSNHPTNKTPGTTQKIGPAVRATLVVEGFRLIQKLGEGGMGEVYEAEQVDPVRRRVALKIIKRGLESKEVLARFESERQALALMNHPNIARVFDAGTTKNGRPYFVMEHVPGVPFMRYCDQNRLTTRERLELFVQVCHGVQHAHHKGVIHRDIKPSNVLVMLQDSKPVPKIIDFGIAKATSQRLTEESVFTAIGAFIGTPEYMSPEQADLTGLDVDTRTDVYSLGVMLYEALAGAKPLDSAKLRKVGFEEMRRVILEEEPQRPSARLSSFGERMTEAAATRGTEPSSLERQLRGDLDWITMKAIEKDRTRRYDSPGELASDIERHLDNEPVLAGPPSASYRMGKFVRRHTVGVVAGGLVVGALVLGVAGATIGMAKARTAEREAAREAATARLVSEFLVGLFQVSDPSRGRGETITVREILDQGSEKINRELAEEPLVRARMMSTMGEVYQSLGLYAESQELFEQALDIREDVLPPGDVDVADSCNSLGRVLREQADYHRAQTMLERALEIYEGALGPEDQSVAVVLNNLGLLHVDAGEYEAAMECYQRAREIDRITLDPGDPRRAATLQNFAILQVRLRNFDEAGALFEQALTIRERAYGPDHIRVAQSLGSLGGVLNDSGRFREALPYYEQSLAIKEKVLGPDHPDVAASLANLGALFRTLGELETARPVLERSISVYRKALGPEHPDVAEPMTTLAIIDAMSGRLDEAQSLFEGALAIREGALGPDHPDVAISLNNLGVFFRRSGDSQTARGFYQRSLEVHEQSLGPDHPDVAMALTNLANLYVDLDELDRAEAAYRRALEIREEALGPGHPDVANTLDGMATLAVARGDLERALGYSERALKIREESLGAVHPTTAEALAGIARLRRQLGDEAGADDADARAAEIRTKLDAAT
ncbi:MAG: serine/threonine-protein kinase [Thermoanaerobaculales bacterium]|jgi:non-specific serine/threonine protein kinase/serine/threonine-protein kinase|nr:serine/threonine-protein kinase [Thermoanaerobaculales bacterium]